MAASGTSKRGISLFRAKDAVDLYETDLMTSPDMSAETGSALMAGVAEGLGAGAQTKVLLRQNEAEGGFSLVTLWFKPDFPLPRHSHDVDCLYYVLSGSAVMGSQTLRAGDGFFVPKDAPYQYSAGPEGVEVLEIRHGVEQFDMKIPDMRPEISRAMTETARSRRQEWESMDLSPTMVANVAP
jgi:mannose-6-phosphate isomerase-like protein (cupin superfamily)